ncbi:MAG: glycosyltransferase family 4 protein [Lachnospiraceae bacterium]|nr:glycosyltransferase family 4 protein [Lachnospiraceae bacterium]
MKGRSMKILFVTNGVPTDQYPLIGIFEFDQAKALAAAGHEVIFFGIDLRSVRRKRKWGIYHGERCGVSWYRIDIPVGAVPLRLFCMIGTWGLEYLYSKVFKTSKPDLIHAHFTEMGCMASRLARKKQVPLVITEHSSLMNQEKINVSLKRCAIEGYYAAKCVIAVSDGLKKSLYRHTGIQCRVIPNIINLEEFELKPNKHIGFGFIITANIVPLKQHQMLIKAFAKVHQIHEDVFLGIVGEGILRKNMELLSQKLGVKNNVIFYGQLSRKKIGLLYQEYDCFVLPSHSETFGVAYIEAMASGLPVIASRCGGPEDFVNEEVGILVSRNSIEELEKGMLFMYNNAWRYNKKQIRTYVEKKYTAQNIAKQILEVYRI